MSTKNGNDAEEEVYPDFPTHEEMIELHRRMHAGGKDGVIAREEIILRNMGLVGDIAKELFWRDNPSLGYQDVKQQGVIGLMRAVAKFDPKRARFTTYATIWIKHFIKRMVQKDNRTIRVSIHQGQKIGLVKKIAERLEKELGRRPTLEEISAETGIAVPRLVRLFTDAKIIQSMDSPVGSDPKTGESRHDITPDHEAHSPYSSLAACDDCLHLLNELKNLLLHLEGSMKPKIVKIFCHRYGLRDYGKGKTLAEVGILFPTGKHTQKPMTREGVRQNCLRFFEKRQRKNLIIQSHTEMVLALRAISLGLELLPTYGKAIPEDLLNWLGEGIYCERQIKD